MKLTDSMLKAVFPLSPASKRKLYLPNLNDSMLAYGINNELRISAFLATLGAESGELKYMQEIASGAAYEGRKDLGNTEPGDGKRFKGRGPIQLTGRYNYRKYTQYLRKKGHLPFVDFEEQPHRLAEQPYAIDSACWFFAVSIDANPLADRRQFLEIQLRVNGGRKRNPPRPNHWEERQAYYKRALREIPDDFVLDEMFDGSDISFAHVPASATVRAEDEEHPDFLDRMTHADAPEPEEVVTQGEGDSNAASGLQTPENQPPAGAAPGATSGEGSLSPQLVVKERPSFFTRAQTWFLNLMGTIFGGIATWFGGNEIATRLAEKAANRAVENADRSDLATFGVVMLYVLGIGSVSVFLFWIASRIYDKSADRSNKLNVEKIHAAASKDLNTVEFVGNQTTT